MSRRCGVSVDFDERRGLPIYCDEPAVPDMDYVGVPLCQRHWAVALGEEAEFNAQLLALPRRIFSRVVDFFKAVLTLFSGGR